ncbi:MAG: hypothetical protein WC528_02165 [Patescibacteria group bacterium]
MERSLKRVRYEGIRRSGSGEVDYVIINRQCTFSALTREATSTINVAENVIRAIAAQEGISPSRLEFFDLQTHRGYDSKEPGELEYDSLVVDYSKDIRVIDWIPCVCPEEIQELFAEHIG